MKSDEKLESSREQEVEHRARTGGEWFARILQDLGVKYVFGTTGRGMPDIQDAMTEVRPPIWIQGLHEFASVCAATGYALAAEETSVCLIDRIVGTSNALGAFYAAYECYAPIVICASQNLPGIATGHLPDGRPLGASHYHSWQSILTTPWSKWRGELANVDFLPQSVIKAVAVAESEPRGPTYLTLRQDLMAARVNPSSSQIKRENFYMSNLAADEESVEVAAKLLVDAKKPLLLATSMGRNSSAVPKLVELTEILGCGVLDGRAFLNFPMNHPNFLGFSRRHPTEGPSPLLKETDVLLCVETYYEYPSAPPPNCKVIAIGPDPAMLQGSAGGDYGGNYFPGIRLVGSSAVILSQLAKAVRAKITPQLGRVVEERGNRTKSLHENIMLTWKKEAEKHLNDDPISPHRVAFELNKLWDEDTVWVTHTQSMTSTLIRGIFLSKPGTFFTNPSGHMGPIASMGYGVALARPTEKVVVTMGDGDFVMGNPASVLWTCSHHNIPVLYIVFNNACWGVEWSFIADTTLKLALARKNYEFVDIDEPRIDFAKLAEANSVKAETLSHPEDAEQKLKWGFDVISKGEPALIDVQLKKFTEGKSGCGYSFQRPTKKT